MAYRFLDNKIGFDDPTQTTTFNTTGGVPYKYPLGMTAAAYDSTLGYGVFVYAAGGTNVAAGNAVVFRGASVSQLATASNGSAGRVGIVYGPISASNVAGWVQVYGNASPVTISSTAASGQQCKIGSTAGCIEVTGPTATTFANPIDGMFVASSQSASSSSGVVFLDYPTIRGA